MLLVQGGQQYKYSLHRISVLSAKLKRCRIGIRLQKCDAQRARSGQSIGPFCGKHTLRNGINDNNDRNAMSVRLVRLSRVLLPRPRLRCSTRNMHSAPDASCVDDRASSSHWDRASAVVYTNVITEVQEQSLITILTEKFQRYVWLSL
jgi:hypothetical protein